MHQQLFSKEAFARAVRAGDARQFGVDLKTDRETIIHAAISEATLGKVLFADFSKGVIKERPCVSLKGYNQHLILRVISRFIGRRFRIALPNRETAVAGIIESMMDSTPMHIIRRDISAFYESISVPGLKERMLYDGAIPKNARLYLSRYFDTFCGNTGLGLPRGIGLSAVLAEYAMQDFDQRARDIEGVYRYFRYADDMLLFSFRPAPEIGAELIRILTEVSPSLKFNPEKTEDISLVNRNKRLQKYVAFEYLGYKFSCSDLCGSDRPREFFVGISDRKIARLKTRIVLSFKSYLKTGRFQLLVDRIRFLSGNYKVRRGGISTIKDSKFVKSGIYFSYRHCGHYIGGEKMPWECADLKGVDGFYQSLVRGGHGGLATTLKSRLRSNHIETLARISFFKGFDSRFMVRFTPEHIQEIRAVWRNA